MTQFILAIASMNLVRVPGGPHIPAQKLLEVRAENSFLQASYSRKLQVAREGQALPLYTTARFLLSNDNLDWAMQQMKAARSAHAIWPYAQLREAIDRQKIPFHTAHPNAAEEMVSLSGEMVSNFYVFGGPPRNGLGRMVWLWHEKDQCSPVSQTIYTDGVPREEMLLTPDQISALQEKAAQFMKATFAPAQTIAPQPVALRRAAPSAKALLNGHLASCPVTLPPQPPSLNEHVRQFRESVGRL